MKMFSTQQMTVSVDNYFLWYKDKIKCMRCK